jgi:glutamyl/glutaminyl-tRNA synthetase
MQLQQVQTLPVKNTRFNPTPSGGSLHLGHLYMILVNRDEAHVNGGKFKIRFDDNQNRWLKAIGRVETDFLVQKMKDELEWVGIEPDEYSSQQYDFPDIHKYVRKEYGKEIIHFDECEREDLEMMYYIRAKSYPLAENVVEARAQNYPYTPHLTLEKVIYDNLDGTNCLIRGKELITEASLYWYFCQIYNLPFVEQIYLPTLKTPDSVISTSNGNFNLSDMKKNGVKPEFIMEVLKTSCLRDPEGKFIIDNLLAEPILVEC